MENYQSINYILNETKDVELVFCNHSSLSYPLHNHISVFTIGIVLSGTIALKLHNDLKFYQKGDTFIIPPYFPHSLQAIEQYSMLSLCVSKHLISSLEYNCFKEKISQILSSITNLAAINKKQILQLLPEIKSNKVITPENILIHDLKKQLESCPEKKISITEMAQLALSSKYHFIRNFKQEVGLTPHQFQIQNRIRKAQRLLHHTEKAIEVALDTGFCDQSHFIKQFEKIVRLTPAKYKLSFNPLKTN